MCLLNYCYYFVGKSFVSNREKMHVWNTCSSSRL